MARLKTDVPVFDGNERAGEKADRLREYLEQQKKELDFVLSNLSGTNFNGAGLALDIRDSGGRSSMGSVGAVGQGVGLRSGQARAEVSAEGAALWFGHAGLRVTAAGVEYTGDGVNWKKLE